STSIEKVSQFAQRRLSDRPEEFKELVAILPAEYADSLARRVARISNSAERRLSGRPEEYQILLMSVLARYADHLARWSEDPRFSRERATVLTRVARILILFGSRNDALARYRQALDLQRSLTRARPDDLMLQREVAETWHNIGDLLRSLGRC